MTTFKVRITSVYSKDVFIHLLNERHSLPLYRKFNHLLIRMRWVRLGLRYVVVLVLIIIWEETESFSLFCSEYLFYINILQNSFHIFFSFLFLSYIPIMAGRPYINFKHC